MYLLVVEVGKVVDDDGDGQRHDQHAGNGTPGTLKIVRNLFLW
jgi:hypothetical protein